MVTNDSIQSGPRSKASTGIKVLLWCGVASSVLYVAATLWAAGMWHGYSTFNQAVSELFAVGAVSRPLLVWAFSAYDALVVAFAAGVWAVAQGRRSVRLTSVMLAVYAVVGQVTLLFSPMNPRSSGPPAANDLGHMVLTAVEVLSLLLFMAFGSAAGGRAFRVYSIATIVLVLAAGILTGVVSTHMTAAVASTPGAGALERVNIYATMLWIALFAGVLLRPRPNEAAEKSAAASVDSPGAPSPA